MSEWVLLAAPVILASFVMLFAFVGCFLDSSGYGVGETYEDAVTGNQYSVSYWRLGEAAGATTAADSKGSNDGTYVGGVTLGQPGLLTGDTDTAALFDGSTGYVSVPRNDDSLNPFKFTVEAFVTVAGGDNEFRAVVSSRNIDADGQHFGYILYANDLNKWEAWVGDGTAGDWQRVTGPDVTRGQHYVAMTYDGTTLKLYVDPGEGFTPLSGDVPYQPNTANELRIGAGANETDPLYFFNGVIDEVAVYNVDLSLDTLQAHFNLASTGPSSPEE
ncbi:MAG TPA: LamG domain-containing protein [Thermoleophilaceae bacterium]|jgi:hypothetical protein